MNFNIWEEYKVKKTYIIHRWGGTPQSDWYPWLENELEKQSLDVTVPQMPNTEEPKIYEWVETLNKIIQNPNLDTVLVGHSIGCQAILRYLEQLKPTIKVDGVILVAPWTRLKPVIKEEPGAEEIAKSWIETPIDWKKIKSKSTKFTTVFSTDDYYVYPKEAELFEKELGAETISLDNKGHFTDEDGVTELPKVLESLL